MKSNLKPNGYQNIALYNDSPRAFVYFELDQDVTSLVEVRVSVSMTHSNPQALAGFTINKLKYGEFDNLDLTLKYELNGENNRLYATFCIEQDMSKLSNSVSDDFMIFFDVQKKVDNSPNINRIPYKLNIFRRFNVNDVIYKSNNKSTSVNSASHLVLRTNPKLSGNIKLVVSPTYDLYLDTFPVTPTLAKKEVRKREVSALSSYAKDVYTFFSKIPSSDIFNLNDYDSYDISLPKNSYDAQFSTTYNYGARMSYDELYDESYNILAPLWLSNELPEYFVVFKVDGTYNKETYEGLSVDNLLSEFIKNGKIVKSWSLKDSTPLGKYLSAHLSDLNNVGSNVFISFDDEISNSWAGIPINYGVMSELSETTYEFNNIANSDKTDSGYRKSFTDINNYITEGFSRNGVICPNLINLQFNFDDDDADEYGMCRYFGMYLTSNELFKYNYYNGGIININVPEKTLEKILDTNILTSHQDRIFGVIENEDIKRTLTIDDILVGHEENLVTSNKVSTFTKKLNLDKFLSLTFNNKIPTGEHFVLNFTAQETDFRIEAVSVGTELLHAGEHYNYIHTSGNTYTVSYGINDDMTREESVYALYSAFKSVLDDMEGMGVYVDANKLSIYVDNDGISNIKLDYITSETLKDLNNVFVYENISLEDFNNLDCHENISLFGYYNIDRTCATIVDYKDMVDYEIFGPRIKYEFNFIELGDKHVYSLEEELSIDIQDNNVYKHRGNYYKFVNVKELLKNCQNHFDGLLIEHPFGKTKCVITPTVADLMMNDITIYTLCDASFNIFSINPIKDFDFTVYGKLQEVGNIKPTLFESEYCYNREDDYLLSRLTLKSGEEHTLTLQRAFKILNGSGRFKVEYDSNYVEYNATDSAPVYFNTFSGDIHIIADSDTEILSTNLNEFGPANYEYNGYKDTEIIEEDLDSYMESKFRLKYGLTTPYVCKWVLDGNDCRSNNLLLKTNRFNFKGDMDTPYSNFIPMTGDKSFFIDEFTYPTYKCIDYNRRGANSYVAYDINDLFTCEDYSIKSLKDLYLDHTSNVDVFSKIMYHKFQDNFDTKKYSKLSYNKFYNTLDTVFKGMKLSINVSDSVYDNRNLDGYNFSMILSNTPNKSSNKPFEVFINAIFKNVLIVWYTHATQISYSNRHDNYLDYKNFFTNTNSNSYLNYYDIPVASSDYGMYNYTKPNFILNTSKNLYEIIWDWKKFGTSQDDIQTNYFYQESENTLSGVEKYTYIYNGGYGGNFVSTTPHFETYNNFSNDNNYLAGINTFGQYITNNAYVYNTASNIHKSNVGTIKLFKNLIDTPSNFNVYIIDEFGVYNSSTSKVNSIIDISINEPKLYNNLYTHSGWYKPLFKNVVEFYNEEDNILSYVFGIDLSHINTRIKRVCKIPQLWFHKVKNKVTSTDIKNGAAIDFRTDFYPILSQWDNNYYTNYDNGKRFIAGYNNTKETSSMFGSKLLKLPKTILLDTWDSTLASSSFYNSSFSEENTDTSKIKLSFNITNAIKNHFFNNKFIDNWSGINIINKNDVINNYINDSILPMYDTNISNIEVKIYAADYNGSHILYSKPAYLTLSNKIYETSIERNYDNYIYNIIVPNNKLVSYYIEILIK